MSPLTFLFGASAEPSRPFRIRKEQSHEPHGDPSALRVRGCAGSHMGPVLLDTGHLPTPCPVLCACPCPNRFPFYFELKIAFVIWLLSPYTKGSSVLYRKFVHPTLSNKEKVCPHSQLTSQPAPSQGSPEPAASYRLALPVGPRAQSDLAGLPWPPGAGRGLCPGVNKGRAGPLLFSLPLQSHRRSTSTSRRPETRAMRP